ncbi:MAG: redoxin domain-containing protein [Ferruginibacter sp.]
MRKFLFTVALFYFTCLNSQAQGYQVTVESNYKSGIAYLAFHSGGSNFSVQDSAATSNKGIAVFKGTNTLPGGIYAIVFPGKNFSADFLLDKEQHISIKADTTNLANMSVSGSKENILFQQYQQFVNAKGIKLTQEKNAYRQATSAKDSLFHEMNYNRYNNELNAYRNEIIKTQPTSMMASLLSAMKEPALPTKLPRTLQDSVDNYNFYKQHYWDGITFMDERIIRTPFFLPRLERYYREVMPQAADSIIKDLDYKLLLARTAPEMYKYLLNWLTDEYLNPKYMGQDAVFVHLFEKYHSKGLTSWLNQKQLEIISRRAYMQMANLIGEKAANIEMLDTAGKPLALYDVNAAYTVLVFWDPNCGHCKEELPKIDSIYRASWHRNNVKIYAVLTENDKSAWLKYIQLHNLGDWENVYETPEMAAAAAAAQKPGFRQLFDVTLTPTLFLLDKDKRIIGKKLSWQQLNEFLLLKINSTKKS